MLTNVRHELSVDAADGSIILRGTKIIQPCNSQKSAENSQCMYSMSGKWSRSKA